MKDASVVIPAYNEGRVIARCLEALTSSSTDVEVVVAANGCRDDTVAVARRFSAVQVLDISLPSKSNALNEADSAATAFPRIYLDADIVLGDGALSGMIEALSTELPRVGAPAIRFETRGASWAVRRYYAVYERTPYVTDGLVGLGVYGLSEAGRARFDVFPDLMADDLFVQRLFTPPERLTTPGTFTVATPRTLRDLVRVRTRVARGNADLARSASELPDGEFGGSTTFTLRALVDMARANPRLIPGTAAYVGVVGAARLKARRSDTGSWHRDESTR